MSVFKDLSILLNDVLKGELRLNNFTYSDKGKECIILNVLDLLCSLPFFDRGIEIVQVKRDEISRYGNFFYINEELIKALSK